MEKEKEKFNVYEIEHASYCLECGDRLPYGGRKDKRFCCNKCRYDYYNIRRRNKRLVKMRTIRKLESNYMILDEIINEGFHSISITDARSMGFEPEFVTSISKIGTHLEMQVFDIGFWLTDRKISHIAKVSLTLPVRKRNVSKPKL